MAGELNPPSDRQGQSTWHGLVWSSVVPLLMLVWAGCKQVAKTEADTNPVGTYALVTVDGKVLPCTVAHEGSPLVKSGVFNINADGTCSSKITFSTPTGSEMVREVKATYIREGAKLTMKWEGAGMTIGHVEGDSFTMDNEGIVFAYRK